MILELVEVDKPKGIGQWLSQFLARPPQPVVRFFGEFGTQVSNEKRHILFAVRNGLPIPLFYGVYAEAKYNALTDYIRKTDHIGPFSVDNWRLTLDTVEPAQLEIRVGLVPLEILTDRVQIAV